jgi:hypothetical protein
MTLLQQQKMQLLLPQLPWLQQQWKWAARAHYSPGQSMWQRQQHKQLGVSRHLWSSQLVAQRGMQSLQGLPALPVSASRLLLLSQQAESCRTALK